MKKITLFLIMFSFCVNFLFAQDSPIQLGADIFNRYIWRGMDLGGKSPCIQPSLRLNLVKDAHSFTFGTWGSYTFAQNVNEETDLYLNYTFNSIIGLTVTDYFFPGLNSGTKNNYFEYRSDSTGHLFEGMLNFNGTEKIPLTFTFAMNFYGNDARKINSDGSVGKIAMSKYVELGFKKNIKGVDFNIFAGATLDNPDETKGETGFYLNDSPSLINIGVKASKSVQITETFSLPMQCQFVTNPELNTAYMVFGFSF